MTKKRRSMGLDDALEDFEPEKNVERPSKDEIAKVTEVGKAHGYVGRDEPGKGKHTGRLGALLCMDTQGRQFGVGTGLKDAQRNTPPPIGARITYKYQERTQAGMPRFPVFMRVRPAE